MNKTYQTSEIAGFIAFTVTTDGKIDTVYGAGATAHLTHIDALEWIKDAGIDRHEFSYGRDEEVLTGVVILPATASAMRLADGGKPEGVYYRIDGERTERTVVAASTADSDDDTAEIVLDEGNWGEFRDAVNAAVSDKALEMSFDFDRIRNENFCHDLRSLIRSKSHTGMSVVQVAREVRRYMHTC